MKNLALVLTLIIVGLVGFSVLGTPETTDAQTSGCIAVGGLNGFISEGASRSTGAQDFLAGDSITMSGVLDDSSAMMIRLVVTGPSGTDVSSTAPSFVIPSDGVYTVSVTNESFMDGTLTASCSGASGGTDGWPGYTDGRLDPDPLEPFAIYCRDNALLVFQIFNNEGIETNRISLTEVGSLYIGEIRVYVQNTELERLSEDSLRITMNNGVKVISLADCFSRAGAILPPPTAGTPSY